jgi:hypothetical protein
MTDEKREQISETLKQKYADGMRVPSAKTGYRADLEMNFRSAWEANYARVLLDEGEEVRYEEDRFALRDDSGKLICTYVPDFKLDEREYLEVKGHAKSSDEWDCDCKRCERDRRKMGLMNVQYPDVKINIMGKHEYRKLCARYFGLIENWESTAYDPK